MFKLSNYEFFKVLGFQKYNFSSKHPFQNVKFHNFSNTQILRETKVGDFSGPKNCHFDTFRGSDFFILMNFALF